MADRTEKARVKRTRAIVTYTTFGVIIVALILYLIFRGEGRMQYQIPELANIDIEDIQSIRIDSEEHGIVEVRRNDGSWTLAPDGFKPDSVKVEDVLDAVADFSITELVSTAGYYDRYELDDEQKHTVVVFGEDEELLRFDVGKQAPTYNHTYIRLAGDDQVYQAQGNLLSIFGQSTDDIRDKVVFEIDPSAVLRIGVTTPEESFRVFKSIEDEQTIWTASDEVVWDTEEIDALLNRLQSLRCQRFVEDENVGEPALILDIQGEATHQLFIYEQRDSAYIARSSQTPYPFALSTFQAEEILGTFLPDQS